MPPSAEKDFYAWAQYTAQALAEGRVGDVDLKQVAEEIEDMGKSERHALVSRLSVALVHMLKIRYQPEKHTRSWDLSIAETRVRIRLRLLQSPSLRPLVPELLNDAYETARLRAARQTGL